VRVDKRRVSAMRCALMVNYAAAVQPGLILQDSFDLTCPIITSSMAPIRILIINPNSTASMTDGLRPLVEALGFPDVKTLN
jgi:hypothetical protein